MASALGGLAAGLVALALAFSGDPLHAQGVDAPDTGVRRLALEQYLQIEGVSDPRMSPDGRQVVYVRQWVDPVTDSRKSSLWIVNGDGSQNRSLTQGGSPRWSQSGDRLAFLACGTPGGDPGALVDCEGASRQQIYVRIMTGPGTGAVTQIKDNATLTCLVHEIINPTVLVNDGELLGKHMGMYVART